MTLRAHVAVRLGDLALDVEIAVDDGEVLALLGPNGAGKTTLLRSIAGLQRIDDGRITIDGSIVDEPSTATFVPPEGRPVGVVFQDYLLFPHLSVRDNVAFGPRARGVPKRDAHRTADAWIDRVGLTTLSTSKPSEISGGQAQRAALARALATDPRLLLLDEPLAALDAATRATVRRDLRRHLAEFGGATVLVTHDPLDALALADRVVIVENGQVTQTGPIAEVTARPRTPYVAELLGVNLLRGVGSGHEVHIDSGAVVLTSQPVAGPTLLLIRPNAISLHLERPDTSARNQWAVRIVGFDLLGDHVRVRLHGDIELIAEITPAAISDLHLVEGAEVWASVKATNVAAYAS